MPIPGVLVLKLWSPRVSAKLKSLMAQELRAMTVLQIVNWGTPNWVLTSQFHLLSLNVRQLQVLYLWEH